MIESLDQYIVGMALGIRFRANFSIEDKLGQIIDRILYTPNSYFNSEVFPLVQGNIGYRTLINERTNDKLHVDNSNIILELQLGERFKTSQLNEVHNQFDKQIIRGVMKSFSIREIVRLGYITRYIFPIRDLAKTFVDKTIGQTLEGVNDINLQFSKKLPKDEALVKEAVNDYYNAIFNIIKKADRDEIFMSVDFQLYFDPFLPGAAEIKFEPFVNSVKSFNSHKYLPWINSNYIEAK